MIALKNVLRRWRPSPSRNIVVRRNGTQSRNNLTRRNGSPARNIVVRRKLSKKLTIRIILLLIQVILFYQLLKYNRHLNKDKSAKLGLQVVNEFEKFTKLFGKYDKQIVYTMSAMFKWVLYRVQKDKFIPNFKEILRHDIWVFAGAYTSTAFGLSGIPVLKSQLASYSSNVPTNIKQGIFQKAKSIVISTYGMAVGRGAANDIQKIMEYIITYYLSVIVTFASHNIVEGAIDVLEHGGVIKRNGSLRITSS